MIIGILNSIIIFGILGYIIFSNTNDKDASEIFNMNVNSIVEVKTTTNIVGESYGTGVIYDSNGLLMTNAHGISYRSLGETKKFDNYEKNIY